MTDPRNRQRLINRARSRAFTLLAQKYRGVFQRLYKQELERVMKEADVK